MTLDRRTLLKGGSAAVATAAIPLADRAEAAGEARAGFPVRPLIAADLRRSRDWRNLRKPVLESILLDDMEQPGGWTATPAAGLSYTDKIVRSGSRSMRLAVLQREDAHIRASRQANGSFNGQAILFEQAPGGAVLSREFATPQDWSGSNRLSLWCYLHPGNPVNALALEFLCEGAEAGPNDPVSVHYLGDLIPGRWNQLTWEISEYRRDRVVRFSIFQPRWGLPLRGSSPVVIYDFDRLELQRVAVERVEGWEVTPGQIAYSHVGYAPDAPKIAIAPAGVEASFRLLDARGRTVRELPATRIANRRGSWRRLDFSDVRQTGMFVLQCGEHRSEPFPIGADPLSTVAQATLNAFYGLRCGHPVHGVHDACHRDVLVTYKGETRSVDGGWHDAANLTQNANNTHLSIYSLLRLADALHASGKVRLGERADEEARWGLDWSMRMRFAPGLRCNSDPASFYTDNVRGTDDDVRIEEKGRFGPAVGANPWSNILAILALARGARSWQRRDPALARTLLEAAVADFAVTYPTIAPFENESPTDMNRGSWADHVGYAALAAIELFRSTGAPEHRDAAVRYGREIIALQEQRFVQGIPIAGYFYEDRTRTRIVHEFHSSYEEGRLLALEELCLTLPEHDDWLQWSSALTLYGECFCAKGTEASAPFDIVPAAVWRRQEVEAGGPPDRAGAMFANKPNAIFPTVPTPAVIRQQLLAAFEAAADLGADHRLRVFPLWFDHVRHGGTVVQMARTAGLAAAARHRGSADLMDLTARQLDWVLGANPFSRSLMYGVGKDWWQNFTVEIPNLVGGMSLGMNSYSGDAPAWGNNAVFPYKEIWVLASSRIALVLAALIEPAHGRHRVDQAHAEVDGRVLRITARLPEGTKAVRLAYDNVTGPEHITPQQIAAGATFAVDKLDKAWSVSMVPDGDVARRITLFGTAKPLARIV